MKKFIYVYYAGPDTDAGDNAAWEAWFGQLGKTLVDPGNPFVEGGKAVHEGGVMDVKEMPVTGYSIINAESMDEAVELAKGSPLTKNNNGAVCVYEAIPM